MRRARPLVIAVIAAGITISLVAGAIGRPRSHAMSRFKVDIKGSTFWPNFSGVEGKALSLFLSAPESLHILAQASAASEQSFALEEIRPVRSTSFVSIQYSGRDSGSAECVASNAAILALRFYATNQPSWEVSYLDTFPFEPDSLPERARDFVWYYVNRAFSK